MYELAKKWSQPAGPRFLMGHDPSHYTGQSPTIEIFLGLTEIAVLFFNMCGVLRVNLVIIINTLINIVQQSISITTDQRRNNNSMQRIESIIIDKLLRCLF